MRVFPIVLLFSLAVEAAVPQPAETTAFNIDSHGGIVVSATFNQAGPFRILVDTGASHSSISSEVAHAIGAPAIARSIVSSPGGDRESLIVRVDRLAVGPIVVAVEPTVVPAADLKKAGGIDGVVGQDVLSGLRYTIDYRNRQIAWGQAASTRGENSEVPLVFQDGLPVVELRQGATTLRLVADSGTSGLLIFESSGRSLPAMRHDGGLVRVDSFYGTRLARSVVIDEFRIGPSTFLDMPAVLLRPGDSPAFHTDGLLPLHIFGRVTFDGPGRRLILG